MRILENSSVLEVLRKRRRRVLFEANRGNSGGRASERHEYKSEYKYEGRTVERIYSGDDFLQLRADSPIIIRSRMEGLLLLPIELVSARATSRYLSNATITQADPLRRPDKVLRVSPSIADNHPRGRPASARERRINLISAESGIVRRRLRVRRHLRDPATSSSV